MDFGSPVGSQGIRRCTRIWNFRIFEKLSAARSSIIRVDSRSSLWHFRCMDYPCSRNLVAASGMQPLRGRTLAILAPIRDSQCCGQCCCCDVRSPRTTPITKCNIRLSSRVTEACPVTTDLIMRDVGTTTRDRPGTAAVLVYVRII